MSSVLSHEEVEGVVVNGVQNPVNPLTNFKKLIKKENGIFRYNVYATRIQYVSIYMLQYYYLDLNCKKYLKIHFV